MSPRAVLAGASPRLELSLFYGGTLDRGSSASQVHPLRTVTTRYEKGWVGGLRLGGRLSRHLGLELSLTNAAIRYGAELSDTSQVPPVVVSEEQPSSIGQLHLNALLELPLGPFEPFVTGGVGGALLVAGVERAYDYGAGFRLVLARRLALRFDVREYRFLRRSPIEEVFDVSPSGGFIGTEWPVRESVRYREVTGGIALLFGP